MFQFVPDLTLNPIAERRIYDNPPFTSSVPRWPRLARLASAVGTRAPFTKPQASTTSPAAVCSCS